MDKKTKIMGAVVGIVLALLDIIFLRSRIDLMYFILILIVLGVILPYVIVVALESNKQKDKESRFLEFVRDLVENVKSGTPINKAIGNLRNRNYGALSPHVQKLANQLDLGLPLTTGLINFASDTRSKVISRSVSLISEAERSGGEIEGILTSVANSVSQIEQLKKEQRSAVYSLVVQGYIIFMVFIIIVLVLQYYLLPMTEGLGGIGDLNMDIKINSDDNMGQSLFYLLIVQSFFAGIVIGKISEGSLKDGIWHSFILVGLTLIISLGTKAIVG